MGITRQEAEAFLFREARLLDERRLDDWLALFTDDSRYWIPSGAGADPTPRRSSSSTICPSSRTASGRRSIHAATRSHRHRKPYT